MKRWIYIFHCDEECRDYFSEHFIIKDALIYFPLLYVSYFYDLWDIHKFDTNIVPRKWIEITYDRYDWFILIGKHYIVIKQIWFKFFLIWKRLMNKIAIFFNKSWIVIGSQKAKKWLCWNYFLLHNILIVTTTM